MYLYILLSLVFSTNANFQIYDYEIKDKLMYPTDFNVTSEKGRYLADLKYPWEPELQWIGIDTVTGVIEWFMKVSIANLPFGFIDAYNTLRDSNALYNWVPDFNANNFIDYHDVITEFDNQYPTLIIHGVNDVCSAGTVRIFHD